MKKLGWLLAFLLLAAPAAANQSNLWSPNTGTVSGLQLTNNFNSAFSAIASCNSGNSAPANDVSAAAVKGQCWLDTSATPNVLRIYDGSTTWLPIAYIDATNHVWTPIVAGGTVNTIASAGTTDLCSTQPAYVEISGTVTITSFGSNCVVGQTKWIRFQGALTFTHNASSLILPNNAQNITTVANDTAQAVYLGSGNWRVVSYIRASGAPLSGASATVLQQAKTTTYAVQVGDLSNWINGTAGTWTLTLPSAVTAGNGWWIYFSNNGSGNITITPTAGTIDGLSTFVAYPGEARFIGSDGSNFHTIVLAPFNFVITATGATTFTVPPGYQSIGVVMCGGGGGGGGGGRQASGTAAPGGGGGGGGYCWNASFQLALLSTSQTVTIGAGGTHGNGATVNGTAGTEGSVGTSSTFGSLLTAFGGGGGGNQASGVTTGGGGGGPVTAGGGGTSNSGSSDFASVSATACGGIGGGVGVFGVCGVGGAGGGEGRNTSTTSFSGSHSVFFGGPGAGGGGGTIVTTNVGGAGGNGGKSPGCQTAPSGGAAGANPGGTTSSAAVYFPGCGGGGGGGGNGGTGGGTGGLGTNAGGGGGGGSGNNANAGNGGDGGPGFAWIKGNL